MLTIFKKYYLKLDGSESYVKAVGYYRVADKYIHLFNLNKQIIAVIKDGRIIPAKYTKGGIKYNDSFEALDYKQFGVPNYKLSVIRNHILKACESL